MEKVRNYGTAPFTLAVIHGGPGAPGEMATVARELSLTRGVLEPLQTATTIAGQIQELKDVVEKNGDSPIIVIGWSWGAWLSYLFTATYPKHVKKLILVSSGAFEEPYARDITTLRLHRLNQQERDEAGDLMNALADPTQKNKNNLMARLGTLFFKTDSYDPLITPTEVLECQYEVYQSISKESSELRRSGKLLEQGKTIQCPVLAIHGDYDPHRFEGVKGPLSRTLKDFRCILLEHCGHYPWLEKAAKEKFYSILKKEIE